jgi:hypothetical protein
MELVYEIALALITGSVSILVAMWLYEDVFKKERELSIIIIFLVMFFFLHANGRTAMDYFGLTNFKDDCTQIPVIGICE